MGELYKLLRRKQSRAHTDATILLMKGIALYHIHKRKRGARGLEPYPSPKLWVRLLDRVAIAAGIIGPIMTIPQIWQIYYFQHAADVSALSWMSYAILDIPFILYGIIHKNKMILVTYILWFIVNVTVVVGVVIYR